MCFPGSANWKREVVPDHKVRNESLLSSRLGIRSHFRVGFIGFFVDLFIVRLCRRAGLSYGWLWHPSAVPMALHPPHQVVHGLPF